jgi:3-keto-disaccharide hydrolase
MLQDLRCCKRMRFMMLSVTASILSALALAAVAGGLSLSEQASVTQLNTLSDAEKKEGWKLLFDGKTFNGLRSYFETMEPSKGWSIEEGCFKNSKGNGRPRSGGGDIMTAELYTDFDFRFEWSMPQGGNSGVYYLFQERQDKPGVGMYMGDDGRSPVGFEYQLLDDERHPDALRNGPIRSTGSLYSLIPPNDSKRLKPTGEFNESRIVVQGKHVEHWLNGAKIVEYDLGSPALIDAIAKSKYKDVPGFGVKTKTRILLQDHGDEVRFRNLKIRALSGKESN